MEATPRLPVVPWFGNANRFIHPIGCSRPGYGAVLLKRKYLYALPSAVKSYKVTFDCLYSDGQIDTRTLTNLRIVGTPICVSPGAPQDDDATMFVELADRRIDCVGLCGKRYNWRIHPDSTYETASLNTGVAWTWTTLLTDLWNAVGNLGTMPSLPVTPAGTPEQIDGMGCRAADLLDDLLMLCGMGIAYDPSEDTFSIVSFSANANNFIGRQLAEAALGAVGQRIDDRQDRVIWDQEPTADNLPKLPAYVRVAFPVWSPGGTPIDTATYFVVDVADTTPDATELAADAFVLVQDFFICRTNQVGTVLNAANLVSRAADVAANWFKQARKASFYPYHQTFSGIGAGTVVMPGAAIDVMCWEDVGDGAKTHIIQTGRLGFPPIFHDTHTWVSVGQLLTGHPFGTADKLYRFPLQSTDNGDPIQRGANIPPGELRTYGTGPFANASGNTAATYAGGGGMSSIMERIGPLRQWDSAVEARSVDGHGQRLWLAKRRVQHFCFVKITSTAPTNGRYYPAIEQLVEPTAGTVTSGDVCWFYDPNSTVAPALNTIRLAYLDGTDGAGTPKKVYMASPGTTTINVVTNICPTFNSSGVMTGINVERTPIAAMQAGPAVCSSNPTNCCPCTTGPGSFPFKFTSSCSDINNVTVTMIYDPTTNQYSGSTTTGLGKTLSVVVYYASGAWKARVTYDGTLIAVMTGTVITCDPFNISWAIDYATCFSCNGVSGTYTLSGSTSSDGGGPGGGTGGYSPCCTGSTSAPYQICLTTSIVSGSCADLSGWKDVLTASGTSWTTATTHAWCVSPFHSGCTVLAVSPKLVCLTDKFALYFSRAGYDDYFVAYIPLPGVCDWTTVSVDVAFDSSGAVFPPGVDTTCCVATVRFTLTSNNLYVCTGTVQTNCCPSNPVPGNLYGYGLTSPGSYPTNTDDLHLTYTGSGAIWTGTSIRGDSFSLECYEASPGSWGWRLGKNGVYYSPNLGWTCSPLSLTFVIGSQTWTINQGVTSVDCPGVFLPTVMHGTGSDGSSFVLGWDGGITPGEYNWDSLLDFTGAIPHYELSDFFGIAPYFAFDPGSATTQNSYTCSPFHANFTQNAAPHTVYDIVP